MCGSIFFSQMYMPACKLCPSMASNCKRAEQIRHNVIERKLGGPRPENARLIYH